MRLLSAACAGLLMSSFAASAAVLVDERPDDDQAGPAGIACVYPMNYVDGADICKFMAHTAPANGQEQGMLVLLRNNGEGIMRRVSTLDLPKGPDYNVVFGDCGQDGRVDSALIGLVRGDAYESSAVKAWTVDFDNATLTEIPAQGLMCLQGSGD